MPQRASNGLPCESVWDYPRPPAVVSCDRRVRIELGGELVAESTEAVRVTETASPPVIYVPEGDLRFDLFSEVPGKSSVCEWKGTAAYFDIAAGGKTAEAAAWTYPRPNPRYTELTGYYAVFPGRVDACQLDDERVESQDGPFYGGWITAEITGPFKGGPGTQGW